LMSLCGIVTQYNSLANESGRQPAVAKQGAV